MVLGGLLAMVVLATVRQVVTRPGLPPPGTYIGAGAVFSAWYVLASFAPAFGGTLAVGTVAAALLAPYVAGGSGTSPLTQLAGLISQISGGTTSSLQQPNQQQQAPASSAGAKGAVAQ